MILLYRILFLPALVLALPYYLMRMWRRGGYRRDFHHRLGLFQHLASPAQGKPRIWLHAVSVGEVLAVGALIEALQRQGRTEIVLTTTTSTGYSEARKRYTEQVLAIGIFPLDFWLFSRLAWQHIQPDALIMTESELWPEHLHQAKARSVPAYLVNARMSDTSFRRYQKLPVIARRLLQKFSAVFAASEHDAVRLQQLGVMPKRIHSTGSIKLDVALPTIIDPYERQALLAELGFVQTGGQAPLILLGSSTWPGEEAVLLDILAALRQTGIDLRLLLVPRHAERRAEIIPLLQQQTLAWHQRSCGQAPTDTIIHFADTTGELSCLTQITDLAFIGKSLPPNAGGQTPIEAAGLGVPILMGPNMNNFKAIANTLIQVGAARRVNDARDLQQQLAGLINNQEQRLAMAAAGRAWHQKNRGSSQRIADHILHDLNARQGNAWQIKKTDHP